MENYFPGYGGNPFISHSLSWSRKSDISPNGMMFAKVWTPEDPRLIKSSSSSVTKVECLDVNKIWTPEDSRASKSGGASNRFESIEMPKAWTPEDPRALKNGCLTNDNMEMAKTWAQDSARHTIKPGSDSTLDKHLTLDCVAVQA